VRWRVAAADDIQLPLPGAPVTLVIDDDRHGAVVEQVTPERIDIRPVALHQRLRMARTADGLLEFVSDRGPCRLRGSAALAGERGKVVFTPGAAPQLLLRSERVRAPLEMLIEIDLRGDTVRTRTRNLRAAGVLVAGPLNTEIGELLSYQLHLSTGEVIEGWGRVARITEDGDVALSFEGTISPAHRAALMLAVFEAQRRR
jgi:hypothetical protein